MSVGVLPVFDIVHYDVGEDEYEVFGFTMPLVGENLRERAQKNRPSLHLVKLMARRGVS